jgi:hypothetical protein
MADVASDETLQKRTDKLLLRETVDYLNDVAFTALYAFDDSLLTSAIRVRPPGWIRPMWFDDSDIVVYPYILNSDLGKSRIRFCRMYFNYFH